MLWKPQLEYEETIYNFGKIIVPENGTHDFLLYNKGSQKLVIEKVSPGCGACVEVTGYTKTPIPSGQSGTVTLTLLTQYLEGKVSKEALVKTNGPKQPNLILTLEAEVIHPEKQPENKEVLTFNNAGDGGIVHSRIKEEIEQIHAKGGIGYMTTFDTGGHEAWRNALLETPLIDWLLWLQRNPSPYRIPYGIIPPERSPNDFFMLFIFPFYLCGILLLLVPPWVLFFEKIIKMDVR